jgi:site-specific DNA-methyltransferase (adenine-specific)
MEINKIYNENCLIGMRKIPDANIDVILTDPPYLYLKNQKLDRPFDENVFFSEVKRVLKKDGFIILFGRGTSFYRWNTILSDLGFLFKEEIIWDKQYVSSPVTPISRVHETISFHTQTGKIVPQKKIDYIEMKKCNIPSIAGDIKRLMPLLNNPKSLLRVKKFLEKKISVRYDTRNTTGGNLTVSRNTINNIDVNCAVMREFTEGVREQDIIRMPHERYSRIHPAQKPVRLLERCLNLVCAEGVTVLDPFSGSGSTAVACLNTNRNFICFEIDKEYYDASCNRITKHQPTLFNI